MPVYRFRVVPADGVEDACLTFPDDVTALKEGKAAVWDMLQDASFAGRLLARKMEVTREDGTIVGLIGAKGSG